MSFISKKTGMFWGILASLFAVALPGCGYSSSDFCDDYCECTGCSDLDYDNCIDDAGDEDRRAENEGCVDQRDDYLSCYGSEFRCVQSKVDADGCAAELTSYLNCLAH